MKTVLDFLSDINMISIVLITIATFAGGLWFKGREKLKQLGELFLAAHEYTDDKRLSREEREDLLRRFRELAGREVTALPEDEKKKRKRKT